MDSTTPDDEFFFGEPDCSCGDEPDGGLACPCGGDCWDDVEPDRPVETIKVAGGLL
jgi:hypothetical protein